MTFVVDIMKANDSLIFYGLLLTYVGSELLLQDISLLQARQVIHLVGLFGRTIIWERTHYEKIENKNLRVTAIPNMPIQELFYCPSKYKSTNFHWNKSKYK